jgi:hypothetical protein
MLIGLEDRPGALADVGETLGAAGINIEGLCATTNEGWGTIHILVDDAARTRRVLEEGGIKVEGETDVIVGDIPGDVDAPGTLGAMARKVADAGVNVTLVYLASKNRFVVGTSDNARALQAIQP